jgi:hypothetical protein
MAQLLKAQWQKIGAAFADGMDANTDLKSAQSPELSERIRNSNAAALDDGILLEPIYHVWDQDAYILDVCKIVTSLDAYNAAKTFSGSESRAAAVAAGWTYLGTIVSEIE